MSGADRRSLLIMRVSRRLLMDAELIRSFLCVVPRTGAAAVASSSPIIIFNHHISLTAASRFHGVHHNRFRHRSEYVLKCKHDPAVLVKFTSVHTITSYAGGRHNMPPLPASWPLTFWPWKWCPSHVWRGLPLCQFWSSCRPLCSRLRPDVRDRQTSDAHHRLMPLP